MIDVADARAQAGRGLETSGPARVLRVGGSQVIHNAEVSDVDPWPQLPPLLERREEEAAC